MRVEDCYGDYVQCVDGVWSLLYQGVEYPVHSLHLHSGYLVCNDSYESDEALDLSPRQPGNSTLDFGPILELWEKRNSYSPKQAKPDPRKVTLHGIIRARVLDEALPTALDRIWTLLGNPELSLSLYRVLREGVKKHPGEESWREAPDAVNMYAAAMFRHFLWEFYYPGSEGIDESGESHDAHALANCVILTDLLKEGKE
jgi:hypothetical protein